MWRVVYLIVFWVVIHFVNNPEDLEAIKEYFTYRCEKGTIAYKINYGNCRPPAERGT
jgi:hypothetical protein